MAQTKSSASQKPLDPFLDDEEDDLPMPPPRGRNRRTAADDDGGDPLDMPEQDPIPFTNEKVKQVERHMAARSKGTPLFPYPAELNDEHRAYWLELVNSFPKGYFTSADIPTLKIYCRAAHDVDRLNKMIEEEGDVIMGGKGPTINPRVRIRKISEDLIMTITTKFRAQPASRDNTTNNKRNQAKHATQQNAAQTVQDDEDGLLAGSRLQ